MGFCRGSSFREGGHGSLITIFREMPDPRRGNAQRHDILDILTISVVASVCGAESCVDCAEFAENRERLLREFLRLENGLPSHDTFSRVFRMLDPAAFGRAFEAFLSDLGTDGSWVLAMDGETLRRSFDRAAGRSLLHVVTAFGVRLRGGRAAERRTARRRPRRERYHRGPRASGDADARRRGSVTGDAIHTRAETAQTVLDRGGDYLFALKANRRPCCARWRRCSPTRPRRSRSLRPPMPATVALRPAATGPLARRIPDQ